MRISVGSILLAAGLCAAQGDLVSLLQSQSDLSTLLELVGLVEGLADTLAGSSNITIFAPTNEAFDSVPDDIPEGEAINQRNDTIAIGALLSNHVFKGLFPASAVTNVPAFIQSLCDTSFENARQPFCGFPEGQYSEVVLNGEDVCVISGEQAISTVTEADIMLGEGIIIHKVDQVLQFGAPLQLFTQRSNLTLFNAAIEAADLDIIFGLSEPEEGGVNVTDFTIFVPNNPAFENIGSVLASADLDTLQQVLQYHLILDSTIFSTGLGNITVPSASGADLTFTVLPDGSAWVNGAKIIFPNAILFNGVAHVIDVVLNPANEPFDRETIDPEADAVDRVAFADATPVSSLPFSEVSFSADTSFYTTSELLLTVAAVPTETMAGDATTTTTTGPTDVPETAAATVPRFDVAMGLGIALGAAAFGL